MILTYLPYDDLQASLAILRQLTPYAVRIGPAWLRARAAEMVPVKRIQKIKNLADIMHKTSVDIYESKMKALDEGDEAVTRQVGAGKDIMSILCKFIFEVTIHLSHHFLVKANAEADEADRLPASEIFGQMKLVICYQSLPHDVLILFSFKRLHFRRTRYDIKCAGKNTPLASLESRCAS